MFEIMVGVGVVLFISTFVLPDQPVCGIFWIIAISIMIFGSYCSKTVKTMITIPFSILMIIGALYILLI